MPDPPTTANGAKPRRRRGVASPLRRSRFLETAQRPPIEPQIFVSSTRSLVIAPCQTAVVTEPSEALPSFFDQLGGEAGVRALVDRFYDEMDAAPEAQDVRAMHPADLASSREKLYLFLCGWLGGPPLYVQRHGHPRLRARHLPFPIGEAARDQWLACMLHAVETSSLPADARDRLMGAFVRLADHMRNQPG